MMQVDFPVSGPSQVEEQEKQIEEAVDEIWREAEQELYEPEELRKKEADLAKEYDAEKVEGLKRNLIRTLKHTANIRSLKADESIIVTVTGRESAAESARVLIIRAKKSDVDAFSKGELDFNEFGEKVQMLMY